MLLPVRVVPSARRVRFSAWGVERPRVLFGVLYQTAAGEEGFATTDQITLSSEPREYVIDLTGHDHEVFFSGFSWLGRLQDQAAEVAGLRIDNIRWE